MGVCVGGGGGGVENPPDLSSEADTATGSDRPTRCRHAARRINKYRRVKSAFVELDSYGQCLGSVM